jgi:hypothetical protein
VALAEDVASPAAMPAEVRSEPDDPLPTIPLKPLDDDGAKGRATPRAPEPVAPARVVVDDVPPGPLVGEPPGLVALADDVARPAAARVEVGWRPDDPLPVIPLKPLDEAGDTRHAPVDRWAEDEAPAAPYRAEPRRALGDETLVGALTRLAGHLAPWLEKLDRSVQRYRRRERATSGNPRLTRRLQGFGTALGRLGTAFVELLPRGGSAAPAPASLGSVGASAAPAWSEPNEPAPIERLPAPLPIKEVPVLRLARIEEPEEPETLYEQGAFWRTGWMWAKRIVTLACVVGGLAVAAATWQTWLPRAMVLSRALFAEIDARTRAREEGALRSQALRDARGQLPHLAPATLELVVSASPASALAPQDLFRFACDAVDRGQSKLPAAEARELRERRQELLEVLGPADRDRVRKYDEARAHRATLPFEDQNALASFARGARALPPASRARLQALWGEAVAAGLEPRPGVSPRP